MIAITVDGSLTCNRETINPVGVDQSGKVLTCLSFDSSLTNLKILYSLRPFQFSSFNHMEVSTLLEKKVAAKECTLRNHDDAPAFLRSLVYNTLQSTRPNDGAIRFHSIISHHIFLPKRIDINLRCVTEPLRNRCPIRKKR